MSNLPKYRYAKNLHEANELAEQGYKIHTFRETPITFEDGSSIINTTILMSLSSDKLIQRGLDFVIKHFLGVKGLEKQVRVYSATSRITGDGIELSFPEFVDCMSLDFKEDLVKQYNKQGFRTIYVGDGLSDFNAVRRVDFLFVIKDSKLAELCKRESIPHREITDFQEVIKSLNDAPSTSSR